MTDNATESLVRVAKSLEEVALLRRQGIEQRTALAQATADRPGKYDQDARNQRMDALPKESEVKYAEQQEYRATVLKLLEAQSKTLKRIESVLRSNS